MGKKIAKGLMMNEAQRVPQYRRLGREHRGELLFFDPKGIDWEERVVEGLRLKDGRWNMGEFAIPQTIYNRCFPEPAATIEKLSNIVGSEHVFNNRTHFDKWEVYQELHGGEVGEYLPLTYEYNQENLLDLLTKHPSLILKPRLGHGGAGVMKASLLSP